MVISPSGKTGLSLTAIGCMDSHRSTSSSKQSRNQSELLAGILLTWSQAYPSGHLFQELKKS